MAQCKNSQHKHNKVVTSQVHKNKQTKVEEVDDEEVEVSTHKQVEKKQVKHNAVKHNDKPKTRQFSWSEIKNLSKA